MSNDRGVAFFEVSMGESEHGTPRPQILARFSSTARGRVARATALRLAAEVELATPDHERWCVTIEEPSDDRRIHYRVMIETLSGTAAEATRALKILERVVVRT